MEIIEEQCPKTKIHRIEITVISLVLNTAPQKNRELLIRFYLPDLIQFEETCIMSGNKTIFGPGKILHLPIHPEDPEQHIQISVIGENQEVATTSIVKTISYEGNEDFVGAYDLFDQLNEPIGKIGIQIKETHLGPSLNQRIDKGGEPITPKPARPYRCFESASYKVKPIPTDKLVFQAKKSPDTGMILELIAPREHRKPIVPPYHEDVGVQTVEKKGKKARKF